MIKQVPSKPHFSVDENANVYWTETGKKLKPFVDKDGYRRYNRHSDGVTYHVAEHRAVAEVFVVNKNPEKYTLVNHIDGNNQNNSILNLEWTDYSGNRVHADFTGAYKESYGENHSQAILDEITVHLICADISNHMRVCDIARKYEIPTYMVQNIKRGLCWTHISSNYNMNIPKKKTVSEPTKKWIKSQLEDGKSIDDILKLNNKFSKEDILDFIKIP